MRRSAVCWRRAPRSSPSSTANGSGAERLPRLDARPRLPAMQLIVALAAEEAAGGQALRLLADRGHNVAAVFSDSRGSAQGATVASIAENLGIPVRPAAAVRDPALAAELRAAGVELLLNIHSLHIVDL